MILMILNLDRPKENTKVELYFKMKMVILKHKKF